MLKGQPGLLDGVVLAGETRDQRVIISLGLKRRHPGRPGHALPVGQPRVRRDHGPHRRVYVRNPDGTPVRDSVSLAIDIADITFR
jgi:hypothetical protein